MHIYIRSTADNTRVLVTWLTEQVRELQEEVRASAAQLARAEDALDTVRAEARHTRGQLLALSRHAGNTVS